MRVGWVILSVFLCGGVQAELTIGLPDVGADKAAVSLSEHEIHIQQVVPVTNRVDLEAIPPFEEDHTVSEKGLVGRMFVGDDAVPVVTNQVSPALDRFGRAASAREYEQGGAIEQTALLKPVKAGEHVTVSVWCRTYYKDPEQVLLRLLDDADEESLRLTLRRGRLPGATITSDEGRSVSVAGVWPLADYQWHHLLFVKESDVLTLYVDGALRSRTVLSPAMRPYTKISVGGTSDGWHYRGLLDDIRVYDRAVTEAERERLFKEGGWSGPARGR